MGALSIRFRQDSGKLMTRAMMEQATRAREVVTLTLPLTLVGPKLSGSFYIHARGRNARGRWSDEAVLLQLYEPWTQILWFVANIASKVGQHGSRAREERMLELTQVLYQRRSRIG